MSPTSLPHCPSLPHILRYLDNPKDVQSCLTVSQQLHSVVSSNYHLLARREISLLVEYNRPQEMRPAGYSFCAFLPKKTNNCFCDFSFYEGESLPKDGSMPEDVRTFFEDPDITENGKVRSADECFKRLLALFIDNFQLYRFRSSNFAAKGKLSLLLQVFERTRATSNTCYLNSNEELELAVMLRSNRVEGALSFNDSLLKLKKKNLQIDLAYCVSFNMGTLKRLIQEWISGERHSVDIRLCRGKVDYSRDLDSFHQNLLEFHPTVVLKSMSRLIMEVKRGADQQLIRITVQSMYAGGIIVKSQEAPKLLFSHC